MKALISILKGIKNPDLFLLPGGVFRVILVKQLFVYTVKLGFRQHGHKPPAEIEGIGNGAVFVFLLIYKLRLKGVAEGNVFFIDIRQLLLAYYRGERTGLLHLCTAGEYLVRKGNVIFSCHSVAYAVLHQSRQALQHADRRIYPLCVKGAVKHYLSLGYIGRKVGHRMGYIVVGHG